MERVSCGSCILGKEDGEGEGEQEQEEQGEEQEECEKTHSLQVLEASRLQDQSSRC